MSGLREFAMPSVEPAGSTSSSGTSERARSGGLRHTTSAYSESARRDAISRTIEAEIIPRLMLVHTSDECRVGAEHDIVPTHSDVTELAALVIAHEVDIAASFVSVLRARGMSLETVFLHLLGPAAKHLDSLWQDDRADFCEITIALSRLQQLLRELSLPFEAEAEPSADDKRILLSTAPGETHTFGMSIVEEFMRRGGWDTVCAPAASAMALGRLVRRDWFDVIGFSLSCESLLAELASVIDVVRRRSLNQRVGILVGGPYFNEHPESAGLVGANLVAFDGLDAARKAQRWVGYAARAR